MNGVPSIVSYEEVGNVTSALSGSYVIILARVCASSSTLEIVPFSSFASSNAIFTISPIVGFAVIPVSVVDSLTIAPFESALLVYIVKVDPELHAIELAG